MVSQTRSLVVGISGQVGNQIAHELGSKHVVGTRRTGARAGELTLDLADLATHPDKARRLLDETEVDAIYCAGAMTHVDGCESAPEAAMRVNCQGPAVLAAAAAKVGIPFIFFSTEYVFDGKNGPYSEDDPANPVSAYGKSKWMGELKVQLAHPGSLILRTTVVYGFDPARKNFLYALRKACIEKRPFRAPVDQISTPTYNGDLAEAAIRLVRAGQSGVFNVCGPERLNRYEFAKIAVRAMGMPNVDLQAVTTAELSQAAQRPLKAGLLIDKLARTLPDIRMHNAEEGVRKWILENSLEQGLPSNDD